MGRRLGVSRGGAALITLGPNTERDGRIPLSSDRASQVRETQGAGFVDSQHAALAGAGRFENVQFSGTARWAPKANARVIAKLADASPLLVEQPMGEGRGIWFGDYETRGLWYWDQASGLHKISVTGLPAAPSGAFPSIYVSPAGSCV